MPSIDIGRFARYRQRGCPGLGAPGTRPRQEEITPRPARLLPLLLLASACATSSDARLASMDLSGTFTELRSAVRSYERLYAGELRRVRADLADAVVARAVSRRIAAADETAGVLALSREIDATEAATRRLTELVRRARPRPGERGADELEDFLARRAADARASAAALERAGDSTSARRVAREADELERGADVALRDPITRAYLEAMIELGAAQSEARENLVALHALVGGLGEAHAVVHRWILADPTVSGERVARLLDRHAGVGAGERPAPPGDAPEDEAGGPGGPAGATESGGGGAR